MTRQEAYARVGVLLGEIKALSEEHDLIVAVRSRDDLPEILHPDLYEKVKKTYNDYRGKEVSYERYQFKEDLSDVSEEVLIQLHNDMCGCGDRLDCDYLKEDLPGADVYESWVPSQFC